MIITIDHTCGMDLAHLDEWAIPSCNNGLLQIESEIGSFTRTVSASTVFFKKWDNLGLFFIYFRAFQTNNTIFNKKSMWKNVLPIYIAGIQTHDLLNTSRHP